MNGNHEETYQKLSQDNGIKALIIAFRNCISYLIYKLKAIIIDKSEIP